MIGPTDTGLARLADQDARDRIRGDLGTNLLVEAGAGSGKTTALVGRILSLVCSGVGIERIAAVTFTRKAAGELSRRLREELEKALRESVRAGDGNAGLLESALRDVDRGFVGTIHAFCARLLRERPLSAGVDPRFVEVSGIEETRLQEGFWASWLDKLYGRDDRILAHLREMGLRPQELKQPFREVVGKLSDVRLPAANVERPDVGPLRSQLETLLDRALALWPASPPPKGPDELQRLVDRLTFLRNTTDWRRPAPLFAALEEMTHGKCKVTQNRWSDDARGKNAAKQLGIDFCTFATGPAQAGLREWYAHRYAIVLDFLLPLRDAFEVYRHTAGLLTFQDLLVLAARLLREDRDARSELADRYARLLVDEFQDTDPLQAEVCFLLASDPSEGNDWRTVRPRAGSLFVVGDPKQSIYRFRRADIEIYELVRGRFRPPDGDVVQLTCNFRSRPRIGTFVDVTFRRLLPAKADTRQAAFAPFNAQRRDAPGTGIFRYEVRPEAGNKREIGALDARLVASLVAEEVRAGRRQPGDFLVITHWKEALPLYARELELRNLPVSLTGADLTAELELSELLLLLQALADPGDPVRTLAVLEGLFFGIDPQDLWRHRQRHGWFSFERRDLDESTPVGAALAQLRVWGELCRIWPIDAAVARIASDAGMLPIAASGGMGESRAGALNHAIEVVTAAAARGATDLRSAIGAIEALRESPDVEAPLRPGRQDAVRVLNLHKAKGLEAPVVILAYPAGKRSFPPDSRVERSGREAVGWCEFRAGRRILGRPRDWEEHAREESEFLEAERTRLLYVATTRAREVLFVGECPAHPDKSSWQPISLELCAHAATRPIAITPAEPRQRPGATALEIQDRVTGVHRRRATAGEPTYVLTSVTGEARDEEGGPMTKLLFRGGQGRGRAWGVLVHRAVAAMGRGRAGEGLRRYCRALLLAEGRERAADGEPVELAELLAVLEAVRASAVWSELHGVGGSRWELAVTRLEPVEGATPRLVVGTVDAVGMDAAGRPVRLVDWKTDDVQEAEWRARAERYGEQVREYVRILGSFSGRDARATVERVRAAASPVVR